MRIKFVCFRNTVYFLFLSSSLFSSLDCVCFLITDILPFQVRERFLKEPAFEDVTLESERKRIFKDFMHVLEVSHDASRGMKFLNLTTTIMMFNLVFTFYLI